MKRSIREIWIDESVREQPVIRQILEQTTGLPVKWIKGPVSKSGEEIPLHKGKRILYLTQQPGGLVKPCPATNAPYLCCRYTVINQVCQCPLDCTYCILQLYLDSPVLTVHVNIKNIFQEIRQCLSSQPKRFFRFGTGELGDSLALDPLLNLSPQYMQFFSTLKNCLIEFKTKTKAVDRLLSLKPVNAVVSWSLNPRSIIDREEYGAASLEERLNAARQCQEAGYLIGFHFDPILAVPDWEVLYGRVIDRIFDFVDASRIVWISMGSLRFPPPLKEVITSRFPKSRIVYEEMIRGPDGKMRYPRPLRIQMYQSIYRRLREKAPDVFVYFCMEIDSVWRKVTGKSPADNAELDYWFAESIYRRFPEISMDKPVLKHYSD